MGLDMGVGWRVGNRTNRYTNKLNGIINFESKQRQTKQTAAATEKFFSKSTYLVFALQRNLEFHTAQKVLSR